MDLELEERGLIMSEAKHWAVVVFIDCVENTKETVWDLLQQTIPTNVLLVDNGSSLANWEEMRRWAAEPKGHTRYDPQTGAEVVTTEDWQKEQAAKGRVFPWRHNPPLPSLAATWNAALDFVWASGGEEAMVCNNDIRVKRWTYDRLEQALRLTGALFVSAVNHPEGYGLDIGDDISLSSRGGPDFSCYLISKEGHAKYRFDENFTPAYCEDLDIHRRYMLGGDGARIFSVNLPYLHKEGGSGTLKAFSPERAEHFHKAVEAGSRAYYRAKWGGGANEETFRYPFGNSPAGKWEFTCDCVTTPQLQSHGCRGGRTD